MTAAPAEPETKERKLRSRAAPKEPVAAATTAASTSEKVPAKKKAPKKVDKKMEAAYTNLVGAVTSKPNGGGMSDMLKRLL